MTISDPLQVKRLERLVKRPLTQMELYGEQPVRIKDVNGKVRLEWVKRHNLREFYGK